MHQVHKRQENREQGLNFLQSYMEGGTEGEKKQKQEKQRQGLQGIHAEVPWSISQRSVELGNSGMELLLDLLLRGDSFPWPVP